MNRGGRTEPTPPECAAAAEMFDLFCSAGTMKTILGCHREICHTLNLKPTRLPDFYPKLKSKLASSWKAQALFKKFDARANHKVYAKGRACASTKVLVIGAGPCGLRAAIECQLLGAKVVVIEKRDRISRNNVLHLWPFVIQDLRALGAKKFFGKFCAGSIDHISIRQLQCILLKVALLLGVEFYEGVGFEELLEPTVSDNSETLGWRARVDPADHPVSQYEFDVLLGADGKRNTLQGFKRKEFRGKLAMAITANFINRHTEQEASVPEISGVAFIFNQKFFKELYEATGIDLENIVYYKDDTHYFVMTAKKHSLLDKGVLLNDYAEVSRLLHVDNVDRGALMRYAQEAARFSTDGGLPLRDFALNHYGEPDVALFDFTSMYAAENASLVRERHGRRLLCQLVGDSLLEPFWPTGSGCARGFLSALDAAWAARAWGQHPPPHPLHVLAERESVFRLLAQTTPENLHRDFGAYTLDPGTRYPNLNRAAVSAPRVAGFYDSDDPLPLDQAPSARKRRRAEAEIPEEVVLSWVGCSEGGLSAAASAGALTALVRRYRPDLLPARDSARSVYQLLHQHYGIVPFSSNGSTRDVPEAKLRWYLSRVYHAFKGEVPHVNHQTEVFDQIKLSLQKEKPVRNNTDHSISAYSNAAEAEKSHSSYRKKRRSVRTPQVSTDPAELVRRQIGRLDLEDVTRLARLVEPHPNHQQHYTAFQHAERQQQLQQQILALLDPEESTDPVLLRESLTHLMQGPTKTRVKNKETLIDKFFISEEKATKPQRKLKGLDLASVKIPDFSDIFQDDDEATLIVERVPNKKELAKANSTDSPKKKEFPRSPSDSLKKKEFVRSSSLDVPKKKEMTRTSSTESPYLQKGRRLSEVIDSHKRRHSQSPDITPHGRSNSIGSSEIANTRRIAQLFEGNKRRHTPSPESRSVRSGSVTNEMAQRMQRMAEIIEGKRRDTPSPERTKRSESIGNPEMAMRRQKMVDLIEGSKPRQLEPVQTQRRGSGEMSFRMQRASDLMQKKVEGERKRGKGGGRRKAAREIMRQRFEKSLQMLATEPRMEFTPSADLENDYGLQQYRASAPHFGDRVKKLEKQLQHYEEGRIVGGGGRTAGGGARVARLAAELAGTAAGASPRASKPKDLMRSVGKIERDDWNVREIERKIMENRLGRPEPRAAEKVPKWDREQFLVRQRRLKEGDSNEEKWMEIDETLSKLEQKLRDSGRPDHGTNKVANLATKFVKKEQVAPVTVKIQPKEEVKKSWRGPSSGGMQCAACGVRVFAAEGVCADGLQLHRACFRCAVCRAVLRPGNYTTERYGTRLVCLRHSGANVPDAASEVLSLEDRGPATPTPERISLELSDGGQREIDEDEWTDRNFLASETSNAGLSDDESSTSDSYTDAADSEAEAEAEEAPAPGLRRALLYLSDDSFGYDDYTDDGAESSGNESCSRMREAREARRREVPAPARPPSDSSEVESEDESSSSSSATEVSTDSEFRDEPAPSPPSPPAILVTEAPAPALAPAPAPAPALAPAPLSRARSAGGLATKRALELKRRYLLGEPSPPAVRKSDSTSRIDTKLEAFRSTITEFQKLLHPAPTPSPQPQKAIVTFDFSTEEKKAQPMPDIIKNLCSDAPVDLLTKGHSPLCKKDWREEVDKEDKKETEPELELESDSLSEDESSHTDTAPNQPVPRVEVHDEGGELIQLDSLMLIDSSTENNDDKASGTATATGPTIVAAESESSESCRDATTLALTETELSDWAAESGVLDDCGLDDKDDRKRNKNPRTLSGPKLVHDAKNISAITSHVCGRSSPPPVVYSNAFENFEFADEGEQDPSIESPVTPRNEGYMELVDDEYDAYSPGNDRSMNFIERSFSETVFKPASLEASGVREDTPTATAELESPDIKLIDEDTTTEELKSPQILKSIEKETSEKTESVTKSDTATKLEAESVKQTDTRYVKLESLSISDDSPIEKTETITTNGEVKEEVRRPSEPSVSEISPPLVPETPKANKVFTVSNTPIPFSCPATIRLYSPAICRSASETFNRSNSRSTDSPTRSIELSISFNMSSGSISPVSPPPARDTSNKVQELKREREEQTEVVRRLVLERLGSGQRGGRKCPRRTRASPVSSIPPPVPPPPSCPPAPTAPPPPPPPRPAPPLLPLPVTPSFSDPELARERRSKSIMKSISNYLNRRLGPRHKEGASRPPVSHKSTGALQEAPPVPPPPAGYCPPIERRPQHSRLPGGSGVSVGVGGSVTTGDDEERDAMQLWFEARWARLVAQRRAREEPRDERARRLARLERRLTRPLSAEQQAATVAELVQVSAQREAHQALMAADRRRSAGGSVGD